MTKSVWLSNLYLCESARIEVNQKPFLIGLMGPTIVFNFFPTTLAPLSWIGEVERLTKSNINTTREVIIDLVIQDPDGENIAATKSRILRKTSGVLAIGSFGQPVTFSKTGFYHVLYKEVSAKQWNKAKSFEVLLHDPSAK